MTNLLENAFENRGKIAEGIKNKVKESLDLLTEEEQSIIDKRRDICKNCPFMSVNATNDGWYNSQRPDEHCTLCECNIELKTACLSCNCGIELHNKLHQDTLELKWTNEK